VDQWTLVWGSSFPNFFTKKSKKNLFSGGFKKQIRKSFFSGKNVDIRRPTKLYLCHCSRVLVGIKINNR
jgi:hypothetical protein